MLRSLAGNEGDPRATETPAPSRHHTDLHAASNHPAAYPFVALTQSLGCPARNLRWLQLVHLLVQRGRLW